MPPHFSSQESPRGLPLCQPAVKEHDLDVLIIGGGMGACGAAYEAALWARRHAPDTRILLVDKAAVERSGAAAQGLSAINTYLGDNSPEDYVRMVRTDLMGIVRDDLIYDLGRHVDDSVHLFEDWGLPCWITGDGGENLDGTSARAMGKSLRNGDKPVRSGRWQIMINGESLKPIVADSVRAVLGPQRILEHVCITRLLLDAGEPNRIAGAVGFSLRENTVHVFRSNTVLVACGGAANVFRPRATGEGMGRTWYPAWNTGSTYALCAEVGAEMTMMENRFVPTRFKDGYGPVGAWFLLFKAITVNALGEDYGTANAHVLEPYAEQGYLRGHIIPTCLRNHMLLRELREGRGPIYMDTKNALRATFAALDPGARQNLNAEAWEDFLDMCVSQAHLWAAMNIKPEERGFEVMPTEPYLLGSHSGCCGIWVSGPDEDWVPDEYKIVADDGRVYNRMTTVNGLFTCADGVGASGHKFASGSHAEGRIAGKQMVRWCVHHKEHRPVLKESPARLCEAVYKPWQVYRDGCAASTDPAVNPHYVTPKSFLQRLMKCTDEYAGGISTSYITSGPMLEAGCELLDMLEEDAGLLAARDLHELLRCWENMHRLHTVRLHMQHMAFRKESRYPGFYYRADYAAINDAEWKCFVNSIRCPETGVTTLFKRSCRLLVE